MTKDQKEMVLSKFRFIFDCPKEEYIGKLRPMISSFITEGFERIVATTNKTKYVQHRGTIDEVMEAARKDVPSMPDWFPTYREEFLKGVQMDLDAQGVPLEDFLYGTYNRDMLNFSSFVQIG